MAEQIKFGDRLFLAGEKVILDNGKDNSPILEARNGELIIGYNTDNVQAKDHHVLIRGNLTVEGTTTSLQTVDTIIKDNIIVLNEGETGTGIQRDSGTSGLKIDRGTKSYETFLFDETGWLGSGGGADAFLSFIADSIDAPRPSWLSSTLSLTSDLSAENIYARYSATINGFTGINGNLKVAENAGIYGDTSIGGNTNVTGNVEVLGHITASSAEEHQIGDFTFNQNVMSVTSEQMEIRSPGGISFYPDEDNSNPVPQGGEKIVWLRDGAKLVFEGTIPDDYEVKLQATDITDDRDIILPDESGTLALQEWTTRQIDEIKTRISDTPPENPLVGNLWWNSNTGRLKIYYQDVDSSQWVDAVPATGTVTQQLSTNENSGGGISLPLTYDDTTKSIISNNVESGGAPGSTSTTETFINLLTPVASISLASDTSQYLLGNITVNNGVDAQYTLSSNDYTHSNGVINFNNPVIDGQVQENASITTGSVNSQAGDIITINGVEIIVDYSAQTSISVISNADLDIILPTGLDMELRSGTYSSTVETRDIQLVGTVTNPSLVSTKALSVNGILILFTVPESQSVDINYVINTINASSAPITASEDAGKLVIDTGASYIELSGSVLVDLGLHTSDYLVKSKLIDINEQLQQVSFISSYIDNNKLRISTPNDTLEILGDLAIALGFGEQTFESATDPTSSSVALQINAANIPDVAAVVSSSSTLTILSSTVDITLTEQTPGAMSRLGFTNTSVTSTIGLVDQDGLVSIEVELLSSAGYVNLGSSEKPFKTLYVDEIHLTNPTTTILPVLEVDVNVLGGVNEPTVMDLETYSGVYITGSTSNYGSKGIEIPNGTVSGQRFFWFNDGSQVVLTINGSTNSGHAEGEYVWTGSVWKKL
jgi:hypothetical protein